jgi:dUTPase
MVRLSNGVTLCKKCHDNFHGIYGIGDNTKEQFQQFSKIFFYLKIIAQQNNIKDLRSMNKPLFKVALREDLQNNPEFLPTKAEPKAAGYDVRCAIKEGIEIQPGGYFRIPLGFRIFQPNDFYLDLRPRSSTFVKKQIHALYGTIDETFPEEMIFAGQYLPGTNKLISSQEKFRIEFGERIGQLIVHRVEPSDFILISNEEIDKNFEERKQITLKSGEKIRESGYGSTGDM